MELTREQLEFETRCKKVIGLSITKVEYSELNYKPANPQPYYNTRFSNLDSIDFAIHFKTTTGESIEIYWDDKFFSFGIGIKINENFNVSDFAKWDVSKDRIWRKFIGTKIIDIKIYWEIVTTKDIESNKTECISYPQYTKITFSNNKSIFVSAAGFLNKDDLEVYGMLDNLTVTDDEYLARQTKMIP
jgi:hypothetical protein